MSGAAVLNRQQAQFANSWTNLIKENQDVQATTSKNNYFQANSDISTPSTSDFQPAPSNVPGPGRRLRSHVAPNVRRHLDYISPTLNYLQTRLVTRNWRDRRPQYPHALYGIDTLPVVAMQHSMIDCVGLKFIRSAVNKIKCPIYTCVWSPDGKRLVTGSSTGEFTLWNGVMFNFETILQAHDSAIRALTWAHSDSWMISADHDGFLKYWQPNMNNVHAYQAHKEPIRMLSFCPSDIKFATCSDDGTARIWDFASCQEERILRGHGGDVKSVEWHPHKALLVTGSRDSQQPVKFWCPKSGKCLATFHDHKSSVTSTTWNANGNWLLTAGRDHLIKLYDIRMMKEIITFRGHKKEVNALAWHTHHEGLFASGGNDGAVCYWGVDFPAAPLGCIERAHDQSIWTLAWHPLGHVLASGSNDNSVKFWSRSKPGDALVDFHNQTAASSELSSVVTRPHHQYNQASYAEELEQEKERRRKLEEQRKIGQEAAKESYTTNGPPMAIPGLGITADVKKHIAQVDDIPGLGRFSRDEGLMEDRRQMYKQPIRKAHKQFEQSWNVAPGPDAPRSTTDLSNLEGPPVVAGKSKASLLAPSMINRPPDNDQWNKQVPPPGPYSQPPFNQNTPPIGPPQRFNGPPPNNFPPGGGPPPRSMPPNFNNQSNQFANNARRFGQPDNFGQMPPQSFNQRPPPFANQQSDGPPSGNYNKFAGNNSMERPAPFANQGGGPPVNMSFGPPPGGNINMGQFNMQPTRFPPYPNQQQGQPPPWSGRGPQAQPTQANHQQFGPSQSGVAGSILDRQPPPDQDVDLRRTRDPRIRPNQQKGDEQQQQQDLDLRRVINRPRQHSGDKRGGRKPFNPKRKWADDYQQNDY